MDSITQAGELQENKYKNIYFVPLCVSQQILR